MTTETTDWKHTTNIYEVNLRQYTPEGTFNAFAAALPRLKDMGVETLWFMPITPIAKKKMKGTLGSYYACSDYTAINPEFGTLQDFQNLVKQAHEMGFKVIIDWVANHTGWDHVWTRSHPDYYLKDSVTGTFKMASGMDDIIELNYGNPDLRKAMIDAMKFWVQQAGIDGFRCDLASWVELDFWKEARPQLDAVKPLFWLGEYDELENPDYGKVFDASYSWKWMHKTEDFFKKQQPLTELNDLLLQYNAIGDSSMRAWFTSNHDENSWNGTEYEKYGALAIPLAVFSCTWNGIPLMYSGQEIPLKEKRLKFFDRDPIPWPGNNAVQTEGLGLHHFYKTLLNLRSSNPALRGGDPAVTTFKLSTTADDQVLAYLRKNGVHEVLVVLNFSNASNLHFDITDAHLTGSFRDIFSGTARNFSNAKSIEMPPYGFLVYEKH
ncbi:alpha-glucosidase C-terminal domain-containing protein [Niabella sp. CC-SYL272]|uniref:alpha-amylase family glycosyl hydrolase n=1 Tax=Niabella agricola TaxID=2891571 RepID=UPI001F357A73|nr:alpha-amylase family glycosyl hydrolase [Niabella agricola]MCF3112154.1 alpha-glucosidase C-terminal domain-containing protein [Niabella agricola]